MAFNSVKATSNGDVKDYVNDLDERTKNEFEATKIESGSSPNGTYMKFGDGTLIMTMTTTAVYAWGKAVTATVNLPLSATNANYQVQLSYGYDLPDAIRGKTTIHARNKTTSSFGIVMQTQDEFFNAPNTADVRIDCMIYGRWK